jgi:hypothetical protein
MVLRIVQKVMQYTKSKETGYSAFSIADIQKHICNDDNPSSLIHSDYLRVIIEDMHHTGILTKIDNNNGEIKYEISYHNYFFR